MKRIKYIFKLLFLLYIICVFAAGNSFSFEEAVVFLLIVAVTIFKEKYCDKSYILLISFAIMIFGVYINKDFGVLLALLAFDFMCKRKAVGPFLIIAAQIYFYYNDKSFMLILLMTCVSSMFGYVIGLFEENEISSRKALDDERKLRYELEQFKTKLLNSSKEAAYLAEVKERNRIAREIHDNIGHKLTGILIQLQAAIKIFDKDNEKTKAILATCISTLSDTVNLIRDTVHNIKPNEKLGVEYIKNVIKDFSFCTVSFKFTGDFGRLPANKLEIIGTNIKEALTNAAKHSKATEVNIAIDINEQYTRLYIKDNGAGSIKIKEGLGLSGMRERIQNAGGTLSVSGNNGFMIVCIIPEK